MLELGGDFFGNKMECVGAGISGGGPPGAHETGERSQGVWALPPLSWPGGKPPCSVFSA